MADTKVSALTAASALAAADSLPVVQGGVSKQTTLAQIAAYPGNGGLYNASVPATAPTGFAADTYLAGSAIAIPAGLQALTIYKCVFYVTKTAAGVAAPVFNIRFGAAGTTSDTSRCTLTLPAQTAAVDSGVVEIEAVFRSVGSGTSALIVAFAKLSHNLAATGLSVGNNGLAQAVSGAGFDSTVASSKIGVSVNGGTSAAWTIPVVQAELRNVT